MILRLFLAFQYILFAPIALASVDAQSSYMSVRALDEYGHSVQLKHAVEAARRHGRLVIAGQSASNETVVVSFGQKPVVHLVSLSTVASFQQTNDVRNERVAAAAFDAVALCCTGIKGDASWLIDRVREHCTEIWNRYDHHLDAPAVSHVVSRLLGSFQGEDMDAEWQPGVKREKSSWARPLGIQTLILSQQTPILLVEPSGRVLAATNFNGETSNEGRDGWRIAAIGKDSNIVLEKLRRTERPPGPIETSELEKTLIALIASEAPTDRTAYIMMEILSRHGVRRTTILLAKGKEVSRSPLI